MSFVIISKLMRQIRIRYRSRLWMRHRPLAAISFTLIFVFITMAIIRACWEVYLLFPHHPTQAWMDPREQALVIKHLEAFNPTTR